MNYDVVVIGAGASGLMAAGTAALRGKRVLLLEKMEKSGRKIRITGKGRCNLTNTRERDEFLEKVRANAPFFAPSFDNFNNRATVNFFKKEGVRLAYERGERVFPASGKAWDIADALTDWAIECGAEIMYHTTATGIRTVGSRVNGVKIKTRKGYERTVECDAVIVCTGGMSYPSTGSTGDGYGFAHDIGHRIEEVRPSLVSLKSSDWFVDELKGVKLKNVNVSLLVEGETVAEEFGEMEFGTRGIEGAVILKLSRTAVDSIIEEKEVKISIDMKTALDVEQLTARMDRELEADAALSAGDLLRKLTPKPLVIPLARQAGINVKENASELSTESKEKIACALKGLMINIDDYGSFEEAVITAGGVAVDQIDPSTLESNLVSGLYFAGEVLDIDADTGGYNLQIAFSTGRLAGELYKSAVHKKEKGTA